MYDIDPADERIVLYCKKARSTVEILNALELKDRKSLMKHIKRLLEQGRLSMTIPDKPTSRNQKYVAIK